MPVHRQDRPPVGVVGVQLERRRPGQRQPHAHGGGRLAVQADAREGERQRQPAGLLLVEQREPVQRGVEERRVDAERVPAVVVERDLGEQLVAAAPQALDALERGP